MLQDRTIFTGAKTIGITLDDTQLSHIHRFSELVVEWNTRMNLTAITDPKTIATKHILDALTIVHALSPTAGMRMIDVGTGAGFPGMVLAIAFPQIKITLTDALQKRITFLTHAIEELGLHNATPLHARAEELGHNATHRECYDVVVARSVASLATLAEYCLPLVRVGGTWIAYKSAEIDTEIAASTNAITTLGGSAPKKIELTIPHTTLARSLIVSTKKTATPAIYPRRAGIPKKSPL